jgi:nicotinamidase/pyrazinamidase
MPETFFVDVDTQVDFIDPAGALYVPEAEKLIPNLARLTEAARERGIPVICSVDAHQENDPEFADWPPHCVAGSPGQRKIPETSWEDAIVVRNSPQRVNLRPGAQILIEKRIYSLFDNVNIGVVLRKIGGRSCVVYGVATDVCVKAAVQGFLERGYTVRLVTDAIRAVTKEEGRAAIDEMCAAGAKLATTDEVLASLRSGGEATGGSG